MPEKKTKKARDLKPGDIVRIKDDRKADRILHVFKDIEITLWPEETVYLDPDEDIEIVEEGE